VKDFAVRDDALRTPGFGDAARHSVAVSRDERADGKVGHGLSGSGHQSLQGSCQLLDLSC
jgi:hypothetical protein